MPESKTEYVWPGKDAPLLKQKVLFEVEFEIETRGGPVSDDGLRDVMQDICCTKPPHFHAMPKLTIKSMKHLDALVPHCPKCNGTSFKHKHEAAHGIPETHMAGTERFECVQCGHSIRAAEGKALGFKFILD